MMEREVRPEWLDELPPDDPRAVASRKDLRRINALMRHAAVFARILPSRRPLRLLEIGAGDGAFTLEVAKRVAGRGAPIRLTLLDLRASVPESRIEAFAELGWKAEALQADAFDEMARLDVEPYDAITANLFLHHFEEDRLAWLFRLAAENTHLFAACEPARIALNLATCRTLRLLGCNEVTRHDAPVSVRAGFRGTELSALWPRAEGWRCDERAAFPFSHVFVAERAR